MTMLERVPDYFEQFHCLAGACPHTCCAKWEVVIDEDSAERYGKTEGPLGDRLRAALKRDEDGDACFSLEGDRCPFLNDRGLCDIHLQLGEEATSVTCQEHPRFIEDYGPFREITLSASCPEANRLLLAGDGPLTFVERESAGEAEEGDDWLEFLLPLRRRMLDLLGEERPLHDRLRDFLLLAAAAQEKLDDDVPEELAACAPEAVELTGEKCLFPALFEVLKTLEQLDGDWAELLTRGETAAPAAVPAVQLERIGEYAAFRYLLKCVNDGDLLGRAQLCVCMVLAVERLSGVCGTAEALRRFSCEIEHSDDNLEALLEAFWTEIPLDTFLKELSAY